jgi:hypothetical protein
MTEDVPVSAWHLDSEGTRLRQTRIRPAHSIDAVTAVHRIHLVPAHYPYAAYAAYAAYALENTWVMVPLCTTLKISASPSLPEALPAFWLPSASLSPDKCVTPLRNWAGVEWCWDLTTSGLPSRVGNQARYKPCILCLASSGGCCVGSKEARRKRQPLSCA